MEHLCDIDCEFATCDLRYSEIVTRLSAEQEKVKVLEERIAFCIHRHEGLGCCAGCETLPVTEDKDAK